MKNANEFPVGITGIIFLSTCGFGSIPNELLLLYAKENFPGHLNTLETYLTFREGKHGLTGGTGKKLPAGPRALSIMRLCPALP